MKNFFSSLLLLFLLSPVFLFPQRAFAVLDCSANPDGAECLCFLDTGGEPAGPDDVISTVTDNDAECQQSCDDQNGVSYQFNICEEGQVQTEGHTDLSNLTTYNEPVPDACAPDPKNYSCLCDTRPSDEPAKLNAGTEADCQSQCQLLSGTVTEFLCINAPLPSAPRKNPLIPNLNIPIPGLDFTGTVTQTDSTVYVSLLSSYIAAALKFLLGAMSIIAVVMIMVGGLEYLVSGGSSKRVEKAKTRIRNAVMGLLLLFSAYTIAFLLDPRTTSFRSLDLQYVQAVEINNETPDDFNENFTPATLAGGKSIPLYDQKQYASYPYGPARCNTGKVGNIKSSGCGVVSFAMVAAGLSGQAVSPPDVAESFYQEGFRPLQENGCGQNGTSYDAFRKSSLLKKYGLKGRVIPKDDHKQLLDLVKNNRLIITSYCTDKILTEKCNGGHYVVIVGMDDKGNLIVNNPWGGVRETRPVDWWFARIKSATYVDRESEFIQ